MLIGKRERTLSYAERLFCNFHILDFAVFLNSESQAGCHLNPLSLLNSIFLDPLYVVFSTQLIHELGFAGFSIRFFLFADHGF